MARSFGGRRPRIRRDVAPIKAARATGPGLRPDTRFRSLLAGKFINCMMWEGKKSTSERIFYDALEIIGERIKDASPIEVFEKALGNIKPMLEVKSRRVGGATYQVPCPVSSRRQQALAIRWMLEAIRGKKGRPMAQRLESELLDGYRREGAAYTKRENTHRMAEANKAFAHYAW